MYRYRNTRTGQIVDRATRDLWLDRNGHVWTCEIVDDAPAAAPGNRLLTPTAAAEGGEPVRVARPVTRAPRAVWEAYALSVAPESEHDDVRALTKAALIARYG